MEQFVLPQCTQVYRFKSSYNLTLRLEQTCEDHKYMITFNKYSKPDRFHAIDCN